MDETNPGSSRLLWNLMGTALFFHQTDEDSISTRTGPWSRADQNASAIGSRNETGTNGPLHNRWT